MLVHAGRALSDRLPVPVPEPSFDEGRHFSYAIQWFSFALIALATYAAFVRKRQNDERRRAEVEQVVPSRDHAALTPRD